MRGSDHNLGITLSGLLVEPLASLPGPWPILASAPLAISRFRSRYLALASFAFSTLLVWNWLPFRFDEEGRSGRHSHAKLEGRPTVSPITRHCVALAPARKVSDHV